jgi:hypothetical protein
MGGYDSETRLQLEAARRIRNLFAHSMKVIDFETNEVAIEVRKLGMPHCEGPDELSQDRKQFNGFAFSFLQVQ